MRKLLYATGLFIALTLFGVPGCDDDGGGGGTDLCEGVQCGEHAHCDAETGSCVCDDGYTGDPTEGCTTGGGTDLCEGVQCGEHAHCDAETGSCVCDDGYTGDPTEGCSAEGCPDNYCNGHGTCDMQNGNPVCSCFEGYTGDRCDQCAEGYIEVGGECIDDPCDPNPCVHGTCSVDENGSPSCTCEEGYAGGNCDQCATGYVQNPSTGECAPDPCDGHDCGHGTCRVDWSSGSAQAVCDCDTGYAGADCSECDTGYVEYPAGSGQCVEDPCDPDPCSGHGTCSVVDDGNGGATHECTCDTGYAGADCSECDTGYVEFPAGSGQCVDDLCDPNPCQGQAVCADATTLVMEGSYCVMTAVDQYECRDATVQCANEVSSGVGVCLDGTCVAAAAPQEGDLVVNEISFQSSPTWFEIVNVSSSILVLDGVGVVVDTGAGLAQPAFFPSDMLVEPGAFIVVADSTPQNFTADLVDSGMALTSDATIMIMTLQTGLDMVHYDSSWPVVSGRSLALSPAALSASGTPAAQLNDLPVHWCAAQDQDGGTPGAANPSCEPDWCNVQWPPSYSTVLGGDSTDVYGQVYEPGYTEGARAGNPYIRARLIYASDPNDQATWHVIDADYNTGFDPSSNNEEFVATIVPRHSGSFSYWYEMSIDGGLTWKRCLKNDGNYGDMEVTYVPSPYFTEYVEGSSNNKAVEIFNPDATTVLSLENCYIRIYANGNTTYSNSIDLSGHSLQPHGTLVVCNSSITDTSFCDILSGSVSFNGDDAVVLECDGQILDVIGRIGEDPGSAWTSSDGSVSTQNMTLRRKCSVETGDRDGSDPFDPSVEWDGYAQDTFDGLGNYTECGY